MGSCGLEEYKQSTNQPHGKSLYGSCVVCRVQHEYRRLTALFNVSSCTLVAMTVAFVQLIRELQRVKEASTSVAMIEEERYHRYCKYLQTYFIEVANQSSLAICVIPGRQGSTCRFGARWDEELGHRQSASKHLTLVAFGHAHLQPPAPAPASSSQLHLVAVPTRIAYRCHYGRSAELPIRLLARRPHLSPAAHSRSAVSCLLDTSRPSRHRSSRG